MILLFTSCSSTEMVENYQPQVTTYFGRDLEMQNYLNTKRATVIPEQRLTDLAIRHAVYMDSIGASSHDNFSTRANSSGAVIFGECIGFNYQNVESSVSGWISSSLHSHTIMNEDYKYFGYAKRGQYECLLLADFKN